MTVSSAYLVGLPANVPNYSSTSVLSATDTTRFQDGALAVVPGTGMFKLFINSTDTPSADILVAYPHGRWVSLTSLGQAYLLINSSNQIDPSQITNNPGDILLAQNHVLVGNASGVAADVAMSGDVTIVASGATTIAASAITNAKVSASAAIDYSKLATLTSGNILVGSAGGVATSVAMSGDATIVASGALTIAANAITTAKILDANVTLGKLAAGITPAAISKFTGKITWSGSGASLTTAVSGVAATDVVIATIQGAPTQAAYLVSAAPGTNQIVLTLSAANTSNDAVIAYEVFRGPA